MTSDVYIAFVSGIVLVIGLAVFILVVIVIYHYRRKNHQIQLANLQQQFDQELLQSQLEIKEQTFATISQEIHDNIGQALSLAKLQLNQLQVINPTCDTKEPRGLVAQAINDLRNLAHSLNPEYVQATPLEQNLQKDLDALAKYSEIKTTLKIKGTGTKLSGEHKIILYRMFQELMNNTIKHAQAKNLWTTLEYKDEYTFLKMQDDGIGFAPKATNGMGLTSIQNRAKLIGATLKINSSPHQGVTISITVPYLQNSKM